jgi:hypothetical protein
MRHFARPDVGAESKPAAELKARAEEDVPRTRRPGMGPSISSSTCAWGRAVLDYGSVYVNS